MATKTPIVIPDGVDAEGSLLLLWVPTLADPTKPTFAELTASGVVDISCHLDKGGFKPGADVEKFKIERLCSKNVVEKLGTVTYSIDKLVYIYDVQNPESEANKAHRALVEGAQGYLVSRWGVDLEEARNLRQTDVIDVHKVELGPRVKQPPEANSELKVEQEVGAVQLVAEDYKLTA